MGTTSKSMELALVTKAPHITLPSGTMTQMRRQDGSGMVFPPVGGHPPRKGQDTEGEDSTWQKQWHSRGTQEWDVSESI